MPDWFKRIRNVLKSGQKALDDVEQFTGQQKEFIKPRCVIDGLPMTLVPLSEPTMLKFPEGAKVYRCPNGHEFSPGNYAQGVNPSPPPNTSGDQHGGI